MPNDTFATDSNKTRGRRHYSNNHAGAAGWGRDLLAQGAAFTCPPVARIATWLVCSMSMVTINHARYVRAVRQPKRN